MGQKTVGIIVGSIRKDSYNKKIADYLIKNTPEGYIFKIIEIGNLVLYNQDYDDADQPESYSSFREEVKSSDGIIFVTPEHNRSFPAALKNALDVGSRPYGHSVWSNKPAMVISSSISSISGFGAAHHLRQVLSFLGMPVLPQPEVYLADVQYLFDDKNRLIKEETADFLLHALVAYIDFAERFIK
ncbi:NADPH-dependent FMN reductase [Flavobacterium pectinovorum]|uniref:NADPH-dependent FMN reductase n=1 Tax=Flavobacterium pectinovorum TaxID=29533 RepID=UPI001FADBD25|nr:NADPH-dependent FMN reductase [Flavobacterium pectinovorum]MCI9845477.1 NAD(P)H-dependent oxidoreductase [Flavobacterium pectinovorum]